MFKQKVTPIKKFQDLKKVLENTRYSSWISGNSLNLMKHFRAIEKRGVFGHHGSMVPSKSLNLYKSKNNSSSNSSCVIYVNGYLGAEFGIMPNLLQYCTKNGHNLYHANLFDILTKSFYLQKSFIKDFENITFVSSDYGVYGMNILKENHEELILDEDLQTKSIMVCPQLTFNYYALNHIGQKLVSMKIKEDL